MLRQEQGGFDVLHLELLQQSLQLWHIRSWNVPHSLGEGVKFLQLHGQICEDGDVGQNAVIVEDNGVFPIQGAELLLRRGQRFF